MTIPPSPPSPGASPTPASEAKNNLGMVSVVTGILSFIVPVILSIVAIVTGHLGLGAARRGEASNKGLSIAGLILGYLTLIGSIVGGIIVFALVVGFATAMSNA